MRSVLDEIRQQPEHIRHVFMWTMVVITFSVVGFVWFRQTTKQFVALLHPEEAEVRALAEKDKTLRQGHSAELSRSPQGSQLSPFATIFAAMGDLRANISELLVGSKSNVEINNGASGTGKIELLQQKLPISE